MKPTRAGYWWYRGIPAEVWLDETVTNPLWFEAMGAWKNNFDNDLHGPVSDTKDSDWGPEILNIKTATWRQLEALIGSIQEEFDERSKTEITRPIPDDIPVNG